MANVILTEAFLAKIAGWQAVKDARAMVAANRVLSSNWTPPILKGVVQAGETSLRAGLVIKSETDIENICPCRVSREWGTICAHSTAVGLHLLKPPAAETETSGQPRTVEAGLSKPGTPIPVHQPPRIVAEIRRAAEGERGEAIELFLILPPNFEQSAVRGKVMLYLEARTGSVRGPLNAISKSRSYQLDSHDAPLLDRLESLTRGQAPGVLQISTSDFLTLLPAMVNHPRITLGKTTAVRVTHEPFAPPLKATLQPDGQILLQSGGRSEPFCLIENSWVWRSGTLQPIALSKSMLPALQHPRTISRTEVPQFLSQEWPALAASPSVESNFSITDFQLEPQPPRFILNLAGGLAQLSAQLQCKYGSRILTMGVSSRDESFWMPSPESPTRYSMRDPAAEQNALARLFRIGFTGPDTQGRYQLLGQDRVLTFFAREYVRMQKEWDVSMEERLERSTRQNLEPIEPRFNITPSGVRWFDLEVSFSTPGGEKFSASDIQKLVLSGQNHHRLKNGKTAIFDTELVDELQQVLLDCAPEQRDGRYRIGQNQAGFLESSLKKNGWQAQAPAGWRQRAAGQTGEAALQCPPLGSLETVLRPYQKQGVAWIHFLRQNGFGGILADEMGLGKTLQALAGLRASRTAGPAGKPSLVVCPTSLLFNWASEAARFIPEFKVLVLDGPRRQQLFAEIPGHDLVITSYGLLRRDADHYRGIEFDTVILDEAQHIKNRQTQNAQAVKTIRSTHRLVLTGTPLENSVLDLWSIFDFLMPGYLGNSQDFKERYEIPITREKDQASQSRLARRIKPFLLRRLKREVARDLPEKIDQVLWCDLTSDQAEVYRQVLDASRKEVLAAVGEQGVAKSRMVVLTALLRLRQTCCDLRLLKLEKVNPETASAKLDLFEEVLDEALDGGHRILVFSQFVELLRLVREKLEGKKIEYCYLDGSTRDRGAVVARFQGGAEIPVFLISLKAGGTGLNLTGADTVIHLDPWWNPAVEDQATGRAHRIGQNRTVTSYKLVTRGTVEEKIVQLQARKREIFEGTLGDEQTLAEGLSWEEIQDLLGTT